MLQRTRGWVRDAVLLLVGVWQAAALLVLPVLAVLLVHAADGGGVIAHLADGGGVVIPAGSGDGGSAG